MVPHLSDMQSSVMVGPSFWSADKNPLQSSITGVATGSCSGIAQASRPVQLTLAATVPSYTTFVDGKQRKGRDQGAADA
jgi:hypothetical protein